jgi:glycosyltransferase involved in cell wall biosynthesis
LQIVESLQYKYNITVVALNSLADQELVDKIKSAGARVIILGKLSLLTGLGVIKIILEFWHTKPKAIMAFLPYAQFFLSLIKSMLPKTKIIFSVRAMPGRDGWLVSLCEKIALTRKDAFYVFNSKIVADETISKYKINKEHTKVIVNAVITPKDSRLDNLSLNIPLNSFTLGSIGRLERQKGYDIAIEALALTNDPSIHLIIAGIGRELESLKNLANKFKVQTQVHFIGRINNPSSLFNKLNIYIQPSRFEGMPNALMEAMAYGLPCIATKVDGIPEVITNIDEGVLIEAENPKLLAKSILELKQAPDRLNEIAIKGKKSVLARFSIENLAKEWDILFSE